MNPSCIRPNRLGVFLTLHVFSVEQSFWSRSRPFLLAIAATAFLVVSRDTLADEVRRHELKIPAQRLDLSLKVLAEAVDAQTLFSFDALSAIEAPPLSGSYTPTEALEALLIGTGFEAQINDRDVIVVRKRKAAIQGEGKERMEQSKLATSGKSQNLLWTALAAFFSTGAGAVTQDMNGKHGPGTIEEVIVTASKRAMSLQEVPLSITAISADEMQKRGLVSMNDYLRTVPSASYIDRGAGRNSIVLRGISADPQQEGFNNGPTVGVYLGEMPLSSIGVFGSLDIRLIDIDRVEILRGPQGTLYGSSALGGAVRYIPGSPDLSEFTGSLRANFSQTGEEGGSNHDVSGVINVPLIEGKLGLRGVAYRIDNSGFIRNLAGSDPSRVAAAEAFGATDLLVDQDDVGNDVTLGGRIILHFQPTEQLAATLSYLNQESEQSGNPNSRFEFGRWGQSEYLPGGPLQGAEQGLLDEAEITNLTLSYDMDWGEFVSSSTMMDRKTGSLRDLDFLFGGVPTPQFDEWNTDAFVQEIRFSSRWNGPLQLVGGYYYEDFEVNQQEYVYFGGDDVQLNPFLPGEAVLYDFNRTEFIEQHAVFGELSYDVSKAITMTLGGRLFRYDRRTLQATGGFFGGTELDNPNVSDLKSNDTGSNFKFNASYHLSDDALVYAQWSEGFRLGRPIAPVPANICDLDGDGIFDGTSLPIDTSSTNPDTLESYELGGKFGFSDGKVQVNAAIFHNDWEGIPVNVIGACQLSLQANAGAAQTQGVEVEAQIALTPSLSFSAGLSLLDAKLSEDAMAVNGADGDRLPGSPETTFSLGVMYELSIGRFPAFVRSDYAYVGDFFTDFKESEPALGDYHQWNMRVGVDLERWRIQLFGSNLLNEDALTWYRRSSFEAFRLRPRSLGVEVALDF